MNPGTSVHEQPENLVEVDDLRVSYGDVTALEGVSLTLEANKIYGLIGRNGSGKTSLLSVLAAFRRADAGTVRVEGRDPYEDADIVSRVCLIRESGDLPAAKIRQIIGLYRELRPNWDQELADRLLRRFDLPAGRNVSKLSRGMKSAFGCLLGLASRAPLTMFDESYLGMDAPARYIFIEELLRDYVEYPRTFIVSTHLIEEFGRLFEEVLIVDKGRLIVHDTVDSLRERGVSISGPAELVDRFAMGLDVLGEQVLGPTKQVTVYSHPTDDLRRQAKAAGLELGTLPLQDLFVHLTTRPERNPS
ncbi:ATP-binding cassette domain-containing protein [Phytomonospora endophytica]|uniref:ABC-2 type transport system ATP-binding protein n=1 Tax=Phytomonospora endophytica TaxID=714109 RepID=A0A841FFB9_9ACTN|nr:ABC transporter ATP-binding protein [Phytomonospora endophytica]MBB6032262.1 ABC-2 type transport system ATP-binding protein [Phytomonospora endophytica]GIG68612.1 ABC transporter [Phytomonospora endophytica]